MDVCKCACVTSSSEYQVYHVVVVRFYDFDKIVTRSQKVHTNGTKSHNTHTLYSVGKYA